MTPDEWQYFLFGHDILDPEHDERHTKVEELMWEVAVKVLRSGTDVILDFGFWTKSERDEFRRKTHSFGADSKIHYMDVPNDVIWERLSVRNQTAGENAVFYVGKKSLMNEPVCLKCRRKKNWSHKYISQNRERYLCFFHCR